MADSLAVQQQEDLGSQFGEAISTPRPGVFDGLGYSNLFGVEDNKVQMGPSTPVLYGVEREALYGGAAAVHGLTGQAGTGAAPPGRILPHGLQPLPLDDRTDAEKNTALEQRLRGMGDLMAPNPQTAGAAYRTIQGLSEFGTKVAAGAPLGLAGMAMSTGGITYYEQYHAYRDQGVDDETAQHLARVDAGVGAAFAASGGLGSLAKTTTLARTMMAEGAAGVATNVTLGAANRYMDHNVLERAGYHDLAAQQQVWDGQSLLSDMAMGLIPLAFHGAPEAFRATAAAAKDLYAKNGRVRDAIDVANQRRNVSDLAPGVAVDAQSAAFHDMALRIATEQHLAGKDVDLSEAPLPESATFAQRPSDERTRNQMVSLFSQHLREAGFTEELGRLDSETRAMIERATGEKLAEPKTAPESEEPQNSLDRAIEGERGETIVNKPAPDHPVNKQLEAAAALPKVADGHIRFFHGGEKYDGEGGRFLTEDAKYAAGYAMKDGRTGTSLQYLDLPADHPEVVRAGKSYEDEGTSYRAPTNHFEVSEREAKGLKKVPVETFDKDVNMTRKAPKWGPPDAKRDSMLEYMVRHEKGISMSEAEAQGIDRKDMSLKTAKIGQRRAFRKGGISFDHAAETLAEAGYPVTDEKGNYDPNVLLDRISNELAGDKVYSLRNVSRFKELEDAHFEEERQKAEETERLRYADNPDFKAQDAEFAVSWRNAPIADAKAASERWDGASGPERTAILAHLKEAIDAENTRQRLDEGRDAVAEVFKLQTESAADLKSRGERETAAAAAEQQAIRAAGERRGADRDVDQFSLTGSDRASDSDPNQTDLLSQALTENPNMEIPDAYGNPHDAAPLAEQAHALEQQAQAEAEAGFQSAIDCFKRTGL